VKPARLILLAALLLASFTLWRLIDDAREERALHTFWFVTRDIRGNSIDSRTGSVTKVLGSRDTTVTIRLTHAELRAIYGTFRRVHLTHVKEPEPEYSEGDAVMRQPFNAWDLDVHMDGVDKRFRVGTTIVARPLPPQWAALFAAEDSVLTITRRRPEYRRLPPSTAMYL